MNAKQTTLKSFLQLSSDSEPDDISQYTPSPQKSALKIPDQWTRIRSRESMSHGKITVFDIEKDLEADKVLKRVRLGATREQGSFLFDPDLWKGREDELKLEQCKLSEDELRNYARIATSVRKKLKERAEAV